MNHTIKMCLGLPLQGMENNYILSTNQKISAFKNIELKTSKMNHYDLNGCLEVNGKNISIPIWVYFDLNVTETNFRLSFHRPLP